MTVEYWMFIVVCDLEPWVLVTWGDYISVSSSYTQSYYCTVAKQHPSAAAVFFMRLWRGIRRSSEAVRVSPHFTVIDKKGYDEKVFQARKYVCRCIRYDAALHCTV